MATISEGRHLLKSRWSIATKMAVIIAAIGVPILLTTGYSSPRKAAVRAVASLAAGDPSQVAGAFGRPLMDSELAELESQVPSTLGSDPADYYAAKTHPADSEGTEVVEVRSASDTSFAVLVQLSFTEQRQWTVDSVWRASP